MHLSIHICAGTRERVEVESAANVIYTHHIPRYRPTLRDTFISQAKTSTGTALFYISLCFRLISSVDVIG